MLIMREGTSTDIDALVAFDQVASREPSRVSYIRDSIRARNLFVAELNGRVVGYGVVTYAFYGNGMIELLYVDEGFRRKGVGRALVSHAERLCSTPKLFTSTNASNKPMQLLLERLGYKLSGYIDNLDPGDPELVYFKQLRVLGD